MYFMRLEQMAAAAVVSEATALVKECLADGKLDAGEILRIGIFVAQKVNVLKGLTGPEKKAFVLDVVQKAAEAAIPAERREQVGYTAALQVLPTVLDIAVAAAHGKIALQRVRERVSVDCVLGCLSGLWSRREKPADVLAAAVLAVREAVVEPSPAPAPPKSASQESATGSAPASAAAPAPVDKDASPPQESPKESSPQASAEAPPLESRPPEPAAIELPNTATETLAPVPEEPSPQPSE